MCWTEEVLGLQLMGSTRLRRKTENSHGGPGRLAHGRSRFLPRLKLGEKLSLQPFKETRNMKSSDDEEEEAPMAVALGEHKKVAKLSGSVSQKCILLTCARYPQTCRL